MRISPVSLFGVIGVALGGTLFAQTPPPPPATPPVPAFPPAIVTALDQVSATGVDRVDASLKYVKTLYMPSVPPKVQAVILFEMSPAELKPAAPPAAPVGTATPPAETPKPGAGAAAAPGQPAPPLPTPPPAAVHVDVFFRLSKADGTGAFAPYDDVAIVYAEPVEQATGKAIYTVSLPMDPGSYKLLLAVSDEALQKIGTARGEFTLPDPTAVKGSLELTPIIFAESVKQLDPSMRETKAQVRKGEFMFSILKIVPKLDNVFAVGDSKEIFYFVFGGRPDMTAQPPKFNLELTYTLKKGSESVIKFAKQTFQTPLIDHPLPLQSQDKNKPLTAGSYTLAVEIEDKVGGTKTKTEVPIEIR